MLPHSSTNDRSWLRSEASSDLWSGVSSLNWRCVSKEKEDLRYVSSAKEWIELDVAVKQRRSLMNNKKSTGEITDSA